MTNQKNKGIKKIDCIDYLIDMCEQNGGIIMLSDKKGNFIYRLENTTRCTDPYIYKELKKEKRDTAYHFNQDTIE